MWLQQLGDPATGEAAEVALLALGERAAPLLLDVLHETDSDGPRTVERHRAALRVLDLLGPAAAAVGGDLSRLEIGGVILHELVRARSSLEPWAGVPWQDSFHRLWHEFQGAAQSAGMIAFYRYQRRSEVTEREPAALLIRLAANEVFAREAVADLLGRAGDVAAVAPLLALLRDRERKPAGHDEVRHNGFLVPVDDEFRWRASEAVLRLAPEDGAIAIAWSGRARWHPHRSVRLAALSSLARLAPAIDETVPDLLAIARGDDAALAAEALKVLGMATADLAFAFADLEALARAADPKIGSRAKALLARLRAAGVTAPPAVVESPAVVALRADVAAYGKASADDAVATRVEAAGIAAVPFLVERLRVEKDKLPDVVVRALGRLGRNLQADERAELRNKIFLRQGDHWRAPSFSSTTSGDDSRIDQEVIADLELGAADAAALGEGLEHANPYVRLVAAQRLTAIAAEIPAGARPALRVALAAATKAEHPKQWELQLEEGPRDQQGDLDADIRAAAAQALAKLPD